MDLAAADVAGYDSVEEPHGVTTANLILKKRRNVEQRRRVPDGVILSLVGELVRASRDITSPPAPVVSLAKWGCSGMEGGGPEHANPTEGWFGERIERDLIRDVARGQSRALFAERLPFPCSREVAGELLGARLVEKGMTESSNERRNPEGGPIRAALTKAVLVLFVAAGWAAQFNGQASEGNGQSAEVLPSYSFGAEGRVQWALPNRLREISGLAATSNDRLFAHDDERAVIYENDLEGQRIAKEFALGDPVLRGDFEGLSTLSDRFFLVTSDGVLYESFEGDDKDRLDYNMYVTGAGRLCEVEGLAANIGGTRLLLVCKTPRERALRDWVTLLPWSIETRQLEPDMRVRIPLADFHAATGKRKCSHSGLALAPGSDHFLLVTARQNVVAEITLGGVLLGITSLDKGRHQQTEGVAFLSDGTLIMADEGSGRRGRLTFL